MISLQSISLQLKWLLKWFEYLFNDSFGKGPWNCHPCVKNRFTARMNWAHVSTHSTSMCFLKTLFLCWMHVNLWVRCQISNLHFRVECNILNIEHKEQFRFCPDYVSFGNLPVALRHSKSVLHAKWYWGLEHSPYTVTKYKNTRGCLLYCVDKVLIEDHHFLSQWTSSRSGWGLPPAENLKHPSCI